MRRNVWCTGLLLVIACSERTTQLVGRRSPGSELDGAVLDAGPDATLVPPWMLSDGGIVYCDDQPCVCANGLDDDGDGLIDGFDGECTGAYDQDEATFATGEVKQGNPHCVDCFFDGNSSFNDDGCRIAVSCAIDGTESGGNGACFTCEPTAGCVNSCLARTPNGCDCFGCCDIATDDGTTLSVQLVDTCSLDTLGDVTKCPRCQPSTTCRNPCGTCELCPGKTFADLPSECAGSGPGFACDDGDVCSGDMPCGEGSYCGQGCCQPIVL